MLGKFYGKFPKISGQKYNVEFNYFLALQNIQIKEKQRKEAKKWRKKLEREREKERCWYP